MRILLLCIIFSMLSSFSSAQEGKPTNYGISISPKAGFLLPHREVMRHLVKDYAIAGELSFVIQANGEKEWHNTFNNPKFGVSSYFSDYGYSEVLGKGFGVYGFIDFPLLKNDYISFSSKTGGGIAYVTKRYDPIENPKNNAISTNVNNLLVLGLFITKHFEQQDLTLGLDLTHMSNGAYKRPNLGLNLPYLSLGYTHYFNPVVGRNKNGEGKSSNLKIPNLMDKSINVKGVLSAREVYPTGGARYLVNALGVYYYKNLSRKASIETGFDIIHNQSHIMNGPESTVAERVQVGYYLGYVLPINKISFVIGMGGYIKDKFDPNGRFYHRLGVRYRFAPHWSANITIKSHWGRADYFEYALIYHLFDSK